MPRSPSTPSVPRPRRGATLVFVALVLVALLGMTAFAVDVSRMYVGTNELQTVSDAASLRGALQMQRVPGANPSDSIIAYAARNAALNGTVTMATSDIRPAFWTESTRNLDTSGSVTWATANAVQVTARRTARLFFGSVLQSVAPISARRSAAWIANVSASTCIKPWGMPMPSVFGMLGAVPSPLRPLTQTEIQNLRNLTTLQRTIIVAPPFSGNGQVPNATPNGNWAALRVNGNGMSQYQSSVEDINCTNNAISVGSSYADKPGNNLDTKTTESIDVSVCRFQSGQDTCFDIATGTIPGVSVLVAYTTVPVSNGTEQLQTFMLGKFVVQCYRQGNAGGGNGNGDGNGNGNGNGNSGGNSNNTCISAKATPAEWINFSEGTLLGYVDPDFADLVGGTQLGNQLSTAQRLILVR